jgi:RHS repeat-associated protein
MNKLSKFMSILTCLFLSVNGLAETNTSQTIGATSAKQMPDKIVVTGKQKVAYCGTRVTKPRPLTYYFTTNVAPYSRGSAEWCQKGKHYLINENIRTWPMEKGLLGCPELDTGEYQVPKLNTGEYHVIEQLALTATTLAGETLPAFPANFKNDYQPVPGTIQFKRTEGTPIYSSYNEHRANGRYVPGTGYCWFGPGSKFVDGIMLPPMSLKVDWVADINWETEDIIEYSEVYTRTLTTTLEPESEQLDGGAGSDCEFKLERQYTNIDSIDIVEAIERTADFDNIAVIGEPYTVSFSTNDRATLYWDYNINDSNDMKATKHSNGPNDYVTFTHTYYSEGEFTWGAIAVKQTSQKATATDECHIKRKTQTIRVFSTKEAAKKAKKETESQGQLENKDLGGDPIDLATGSMLITHNLLTVQGVLPLSFSINYHSLLSNEGILGKAWGHEQFDAYLQELPNGDIKVHWTTNHYNMFTKNAEGTYTTSHDTTRFDTLVKDDANGSFTLTRKNQLIYEFDAVGQLVALRNRQGQSLTFTRDEEGRITQVTEPVSGVFLRYVYNTEGLLKTVSDPLDREVHFEYDSKRNLTKITDAAGQTVTYTYDKHGQVLTGTDSEGVQFFSNTYDGEYRVIAQKDAVTANQQDRLSFDDSQPNRTITTFTNRNGESQVYTYDENYYLLSFEDELGNITHYTYDANGKRTSTTDANSNTTRFEYDANGNLTKITDAKGGITQMVYDANSNLLSVTNALGKTTTFSYDANNNRMSATDALGNTTRYTYNRHGQVVTETGPSGAVTTYEYQNGLPVRVTDPEGNTQTSRYDAAGRLLSTTDAEGHTTTFAYDGVNRLISVTDALNRTVSMTYDSWDNLLTSTDAKGNITRRSYDGNGRLISQINALAQQTRYKYDGAGRLLKVIDAKGHVTQLGYDAKGRLISTTDALGNTQQLSYDAADNLLTAIDALGKTVVTYNYDGLNNPLSVTNALGHQTQSDYDALGRLTRVTEPLNWATQFNYDDNDRLVASVDAKNGQSRQTFDAEGNLTGLTDPNNHQTTFQFDNNGRLVQEASASGGRVRYSYNARDLLTTITNARGQQRQLEYDAVGRLTRLTDADGTVSYTYDDNDNVLTVTDANGTISREYDALDRVVKYTDSQGKTLQYAYDAVGNLETLTYPDGKQVFYEYDAADQLTKVTDWAKRQTRYAYDANGRLVEVIRPNGTRMTYTYNVAGQLVQQQDMASDGKVIRQFEFVYDAAGDIVKEQVVPEPTPFPFIPATMTYTSANRLATYNGKAVTFDADGNMTLGPLNGELVDFTFDARNRLSNVGETTYRYDVENQRIAVNVAGQATRYVINSQAVLSQVLLRTAPDGTQTFYVYGLGLIGEETAGVYQAYHFDLRGSTVALSDATGNVVEQFQYSPFGGLVSHNPAEVDTPFLYNGRDGVMTDDTGLYYMRARYYNQEIRRFVNRDVLLGGINDGQTLNRFAYVTGEPVQFVDPSGLLQCYPLPESYGTLGKGVQGTINVEDGTTVIALQNKKYRIDGVTSEKITPSINIKFANVSFSKRVGNNKYYDIKFAVGYVHESGIGGALNIYECSGKISEIPGIGNVIERNKRLESHSEGVTDKSANFYWLKELINK